MREQGEAKGGSPDTQVERYFSLMALSLQKLQCYTKRVLHAIMGKTRNRINNLVGIISAEKLDALCLALGVIGVFIILTVSFWKRKAHKA